MLNQRFLCLRYIATTFILCLFLFTACQDSSDNNTDSEKETDNPTGNTWIEFKNLEHFPVTIYSDPARQVVFTEIPANGTKKFRRSLRLWEGRFIRLLFLFIR